MKLNLDKTLSMLGIFLPKESVVLLLNISFEYIDLSAKVQTKFGQDKNSLLNSICAEIQKHSAKH